MYMPTLARFTALDPLPPDGVPVLLGRVPTGPRLSIYKIGNAFIYCNNDPLNWIDPSGLQAIPVSTVRIFAKPAYVQASRWKHLCLEVDIYDNCDDPCFPPKKKETYQLELLQASGEEDGVQRAPLSARVGVGPSGVGFLLEDPNVFIGAGVKEAWDMKTAKPIGLLRNPDARDGLPLGNGQMSVSRDGRWAVHVCSDNRIAIWDLKEQIRVHEVESLPADVMAIAISPDGEEMTVGNAAGDLIRWNTKSAKIGEKINVCLDVPISGIAYAPNGKHVVVGSATGVWIATASSDGQTTLRKISDEPVGKMAFTPNGKKITGTGQSTVTIWDASSRKVDTATQLVNFTPVSISISKDSRILALGGGGRGRDFAIRIIDLDTGKIATTLEGHTEPVIAVEFSRVRDVFVSGSIDGTIKTWKVSRK